MLARKLHEEGNGTFLVEITSFLTPMYQGDVEPLDLLLSVPALRNLLRFVA